VSGSVLRPRLGLIVPSTNLTIERLLHRLSFSELFGVDIVVTRLKVATIAATSDSKRQFHPRRLRAAAQLLADARPDVIAWTGTSSFWLGVDEENWWMSETGNQLGVRITSATEAVMAGHLACLALYSVRDADSRFGDQHAATSQPLHTPSQKPWNG